MAENTINCIILAAGKGTRMKSKTHKVMHEIGGIPMIGHVLDLCQNKLAAKSITVIADPDETSVSTYVEQNSKAAICFQNEKLGTGHAVQMAKKQIESIAKTDPNSTVIVLYADTPFVRVETFEAMASKICAGNEVVVLGFEPNDPAQYGRLLTDENDALIAIREYKDATEIERAVDFCNAGIMAFKAKYLNELLHKINNDNASGEYYLTDCVEIANSMGLKCNATKCSVIETLGINDRLQLAEAEGVYQTQLRQNAMRNGVTMIDPNSIYLSGNVSIGTDVIIEANVTIKGHVVIEDGVNIFANCYIEGTKANPVLIGLGANIGPFARLREGTVVGEKAKIGNFVETKKANIAKGAKINHLSYIGDSEIGEFSNIGAGTITCNYDGFNKFKTKIGKGVFIGSNSSLVAPIVISDGSYVGSGSVVTKNVSADALVVTRAKQIQINLWAKKFRDKQKKK